MKYPDRNIYNALSVWEGLSFRVDCNSTSVCRLLATQAARHRCRSIG